MPGTFSIGYNVGVGSVKSKSKAAGYFKFDLLWPLLISYLMNWYPRRV